MHARTNTHTPTHTRAHMQTHARATLLASPPARSVRMICCIHVVPHLGKVAITMSAFSPPRSVLVLQKSTATHSTRHTAHSTQHIQEADFNRLDNRTITRVRVRVHGGHESSQGVMDWHESSQRVRHWHESSQGVATGAPVQ